MSLDGVIMNLSSASVNVPNTVAPYNPAGSKPVGLESGDMKSSSFRPVEQSPATAKLASGPQSKSATQTSPVKSQSERLDELADKEAEEERKRAREEAEARQLEIDQRKIQDLAARDREVRAHEQAHAAAGGQYAGAPSYSYERGPDGRSYAVGGEVQIDVGKAGTPEDTIQKAKVVRNAALAPAEPSPQDRRVAAMATRMESQARVEMREQAIENEKLKEEEIRVEQERIESSKSDDRIKEAKDADFEKNDADDNDLGSATINGIEKTNSTFGQLSSSEGNSSKGSILDQLA